MPRGILLESQLEAIDVIQRASNIETGLIQDVRVNLRCLDVFVAKNFLNSSNILSALEEMFRGKFLAGLKRLLAQQEIVVQGEFNTLMRALYEKDWVVYAKPAFKGPGSVLDYIGRYTHRVAISNERILHVGNNQVTFSYRDRQAANQKKEMTLSSEEFIRRFLLHVLPPSFMKIRHIGFLANKRKKNDLARCRALLGTVEVKPEKKSTRELLKVLTGLDLDQCPHCHLGTMVTTLDIPKPLLDSS